MHEVMAHLSGKKAPEAQCVVLSFKATWRRELLKNAFFLDASFWLCSGCMDPAALKA